jgi:ABC-type transport system involved in multi-copper enzyme maturation permease subunit
VGGAFPSVQIQFAGDNIKLNSPWVINLVLSIFSFVGIFITASVISNIIYKDFKYDSLSLTFTTRVKKFDFLIGRFIAALLINIFIFLGPAIGLIIGSEMPYLNRSMFGEIMPMAYINTYLTRIIPNLFFVIAIFFTMTLLLRNIVVNWFVIILLYVLYAVGGRLINDLDNQTLAGILDPFGMASSMKVSSNFSSDDANTKTIPLESIYLLNRIVWVSIGLITLMIGYFRFSFSYSNDRLKRKKKLKKEEQKTSNQANAYNQEIIRVQPQYGFQHRIMAFLSMTRKELKQLLTNVYFILITITGIAFLIVASQAIGKAFDTNTYPVTYQVIEILGGTFNLFVIIIIILFSGEMVWKSRALKTDEIDDILPISNRQILWSKIVALCTSVLGLLTLLIFSGILIQFFKGYTNYEPWQYIKSVLGLQFSAYLLIIFLAFFVQVIVNNKFLAYALMILYFVWDSQFATAVLQNNAFIYGNGPSYLYSDMNGYSEGMWVVLLYRFYWFALALILSFISAKIWPRGKESLLKIRIKEIRIQKLWEKILIPSLVLIFLGSGSFILYNTNGIHDFNTSYDGEKERVRYEREFKQYKQLPQPRISAIDAKFDLYPESGDAKIKAEYTLVNRTEEPIDKLILSYDQDMMKNLEFEDGAQLSLSDDKLNFHIYDLNKKLIPGDSIQLSFEMEHIVEGFTNSGVSVMTHKNGTFLHSDILPSLGYSEGMELKRKKIREKHDLDVKPIENSRDDLAAIQNNFITDDADFIRLNIEISTSADQIATAPGYCYEKWKKNGRNHFKYRSDVPVINYFAVLSAQYALVEDQWIPEDSTMKPVDIKVYYHEDHSWNISNIVDGVKASLSFYSENYCYYPHPELKIVEFPRYASFAQSFPGMIPFSEAIGFIADLEEDDKEEIAVEDMKIDYPYWVTAHEMAHQWLAHHVIAADTEGAQMLMEAVTQFSSLKVIEDHFEEERINKFMRMERNKYIMSRQNESFEEQPLATVWGHQSSIYYQKGMLVLRAINDYLGNDKLVKVTGDFINEHKFKNGPYPTTNDYISKIREVTPDSMTYIIDDWLESICFYNFEIISATWERNEDLEYFVDLEIKAGKSIADGLGKEKEVAMNDHVEIGIFNSKGKEIYKQKLRLQDGTNKLRLKLGRKPSKLIIDPDYKLITKELDAIEELIILVKNE